VEKLLLAIGRMACSFCTETLKEDAGRRHGAAEVRVRLTPEQALVQAHR
jgi:hypothetical protein